MMATHFKPWESGGRYGTHYLFDKEGDGIAMHAHALPELWHSTLCLKGVAVIYGDGIDLRLCQGDEAAFPSFRQHEIVALEPNTEIANVLVRGAPGHHSGPDAPDMSGSVEVVLMGRTEFPL